MPRLYFVRHALPSPRTLDDRDPPLDPRGIEQAEAMAQSLAAAGPLPLYSSPLARCRMTAAPLASRWGAEPEIFEAVREIPAPGREGAERGAFLDELLRERWSEVLAREGGIIRRWYDALLAGVKGVKEDSVIVSHYIAINVIAGLATGSDRVSTFRPGHASVTIVESKGDGFRLLQLGSEARTQLTSG